MQDIFAKRLIELLEEYNMTQLELSKLIGTTNVTISRYINGERKPRIEIVAKIAEVLNTSIDYLFGLTNDKKILAPNYTDSKLNINMIKIQDKLDALGLLNSNKELSSSQVDIIEKLLDANQEFIKKLKDDSIGA